MQQPLHFPAHDDEWLRAAGFDPARYPEYESLRDYLARAVGIFSSPPADSDWAMLEDDGWFDADLTLSLEERFEKFDVSIVKNLGGDTIDNLDTYNERTIELSNGLILKEALGPKPEHADEHFEDLYYKVIVVNEPSLPRDTFTKYQQEIEALKAQITKTSDADPFPKSFPERLALTVAWVLNHSMSFGWLSATEDRRSFRETLCGEAGHSIDELARKGE